MDETRNSDPRTAAQQAADAAAAADTSDRRERAKKTAADKAAALSAPIHPLIEPGPNPPEQAVHVPAAQIPGARAEWGGAPPVPRPAGAGIRVQAHKMGYHGDKLQRVGDVFTIEDAAAFAPEWMHRVAPTTPEQTTSSNEALRREHADLVSGAAGRPATGDTDPLGTRI